MPGASARQHRYGIGIGRQTDQRCPQAARQAFQTLAARGEIVSPALGRRRAVEFNKFSGHSQAVKTRWWWLGFQGVVVSDSLLMGGIRDRYADAGAQAVALVQAGVATATAAATGSSSTPVMSSARP